MFDTMVTVVGNVLNTPQWRRIDDGQLLVTNFKVAGTSRRYNRQTDQWVDGSSLRVRVNCWRRLAENVNACVTVGDPIIVTGRLYSRDWEGEDHVRRISYEIDAVAVGHDLAKGRGRFARHRPNLNTSSVEDEEAEARVRGSLSTPVDELNEVPRERVYDEELGGFVTEVNAPAEYSAEYGSGFSALTSVGAYGGSLRADDGDFESDLEADDLLDDLAVPTKEEDDEIEPEPESEPESEPGSEPGSDGEPESDPAPRKRGRRVPVPA